MSELRQTEAPPAGEEIHMPSPSVLPLINAAALAAAIVTITFHWWLSVAFAVIFLITTVRWVRETVRDVNALPLDHSGH